ncbi:hypothetical protein GE061_002771 [Apolygus lucorum]|uniref:Uncharacterized protein n=1 Tax=Apolygus lucorum TaxID=248454 RepID=A0A6A4KCW8_APOLU|nr:hypothetical protein GE061_002771 [Apolygus lucorum]
MAEKHFPIPPGPSEDPRTGGHTRPHPELPKTLRNSVPPGFHSMPLTTLEMPSMLRGEIEAVAFMMLKVAQDREDLSPRLREICRQIRAVVNNVLLLTRTVADGQTGDQQKVKAQLPIEDMFEFIQRASNMNICRLDILEQDLHAIKGGLSILHERNEEMLDIMRRLQENLLAEMKEQLKSSARDAQPLTVTPATSTVSDGPTTHIGFDKLAAAPAGPSSSLLDKFLSPKDDPEKKPTTTTGSWESTWTKKPSSRKYMFSAVREGCRKKTAQEIQTYAQRKSLEACCFNQVLELESNAETKIYWFCEVCKTGMFKVESWHCQVCLDHHEKNVQAWQRGSIVDICGHAGEEPQKCDGCRLGKFVALALFHDPEIDSPLLEIIPERFIWRFRHGIPNDHSDESSSPNSG